MIVTPEYGGRKAYGQSKLALVMLTFDLAAALQGTGVTANAIHPAREGSASDRKCPRFHPPRAFKRDVIVCAPCELLRGR